MKRMEIPRLAFFMAVALLVSLPHAGAAENPYKLKPGAAGKICLTCHLAFAATMEKPYVHTPLREGQCSGCHNPHTASHGNLLDREGDRICYTCHDAMVPENAASSHEVVVEGKCNLCHDSHAADNENNLLKAGKNLCFDCHKELAEEMEDMKFPHSPVENDCLSCHNAHASTKNVKLLTKAEPDLCLTCHETGKASFKKFHLNYPVNRSRCTSCHNPHGSNTAALLYDNVHKPVLNKMCNQCHADPDDADPLQIKKNGYELCQGCHYDMVNASLAKDRLHWPMVDDTGCMNCHTPHASAEPGLLEGKMIDVCGKCHEDTIERQEKALQKHPPIAEGRCTECHDAHSSNNILLYNKPVIFDLCGKCHEWQTHSTHPIGDEVVDPRNPNVTLDCLSCHGSHGTEFNHMLFAQSTTEMCTKCHVQFKR